MRLPPATRHFLRHFVEMAVAMLLGMALAEPLVSALSTDAPALAVLVMALAMSVPVAAWMRYRRHSWSRVGEMVGAMLAPALVLVALLGAEALDGGKAALDILHGAMLPSMLAVMALRRGEYQRWRLASSATGARRRVRPLCRLCRRGTARATSTNL